MSKNVFVLVAMNNEDVNPLVKVCKTYAGLMDATFDVLLETYQGNIVDPDTDEPIDLVERHFSLDELDEIYQDQVLENNTPNGFKYWHDVAQLES